MDNFSFDTLKISLKTFVFRYKELFFSLHEFFCVNWYRYFITHDYWISTCRKYRSIARKYAQLPSVTECYTGILHTFFGRADLKSSSSTRKRYLSSPSLFPVLPIQYKQNTKIIIYRPPHPPHPGRPLGGWPTEPGEPDALHPGCGEWLFSFSHLGLVATPRTDPFSTHTYGGFAPPHAGGRLQREIAFSFHRIVEPGGKSEVQTGTPLSISSKSPRRPAVGVRIPLSDFRTRSALVRSGYCLAGPREESELVSMFRDHHPVSGGVS